MADEFTEEIGPGLGLVLSNIAIVPALTSSITYGLYSEGAMLLTLAWVSTNYHLCQADFICSFPFHILQISDHFFVYSTLVWIYLYLLQITTKKRFILFIISQSFLLPFIMTKIRSWWIGGVLLISLAVITIFAFLMWFKWEKKISKPDLFASIILIGIGFFFHVYAGEPGEKKYPIYHSFWHALAFISIFLVIELTESKGIIKSLFSSSPKKVKKRIKKKSHKSSSSLPNV